MEGVMAERYGQRVGERLRVENARAMVTRVLRSATTISAFRTASPIEVISHACSTGSLA